MGRDTSAGPPTDLPFEYGDHVAVREDPNGAWFAGTATSLGSSGLTITHYADDALVLYVPWGTALISSVPQAEWDAMVAEHAERQARRTAGDQDERGGRR